MVLPPVMTGLVIAGTLLTISTGVIAVRKRPNRLAGPIVFLSLAVIVWLVPIGIGYHTAVDAHHQWLQRIRYTGTALVPLAYFLVAFRYAGYRTFTRPLVVAIVSIIPILTIILVWSTHVHGLVWNELHVGLSAGIWTATFDSGPWFYVHLAWAYSLVLAGLVVVLQIAIQDHGKHRQQAIVLFVGAAVPFVLNTAHYTGIGPLGVIDLTPVAIGLGALIFGLGVVLFDLVELRPVARDRLIEQLRDGVIVLDARGRIRDSNPVARQILAQFRKKGMDRTVVPDRLYAEGNEIEASVNGFDRWYRTEVHRFNNARGRDAGEIIYLNDISELARREQRISVLHRVLRHNIRNEMTILFGHLEYVQRAISGHVVEDLQQIEHSADRIMGFAENARLIERTLKQDSGTEAVNVETCLEQAIGEVWDTNGYPDSIASVRTDGLPMVDVVDQELLVRALAELIENAVIHGDGAVEVEGHRRENWIDIDILDEGPGIPAAEIEALEAPVETSLEHGSGLGLWVARWTADLSGGELRFRRQGQTNIVCLRLPIASE